MRQLYIFIFFCSTSLFHPSVATSQKSPTLEAGITAFDAGNTSEAKTIFQALHKASPKEAEPAYYLGRIEMLDSMHGKAMDWFEKATKLDNNKAEYQYWLSNAIFIEINNVGALKKMRYSRKGKTALDRCIEIAPQFPECHLSLANFYYMAPGIAGGDKEKSWQHARKYRDFRPAHGSMFMAQRYASEEDFEAAEKVMTELLANTSDDVEAFRYAGMYYLGQKQFTRAFDLFDKAIKLAPDAAYPSYYQFGKTAALSQERIAEGLDALTTYLDYQPGPYDPSHASAHWRMGMLHELNGDTQSAKSSYQKALLLEPDHKLAKEALKAIS